MNSELSRAELILCERSLQAHAVAARIALDQADPLRAIAELTRAQPFGRT